VLTAQLEHFDEIQRMRRRVWDTYHTALEKWAADQGVSRPQPPPHVEHPSHLYHLVLADGAHQQSLMKHLANLGIRAVSHYVPLHDSPAGARLARPGGDCPVTERVSDSLLRLPLYPGLTDTDLDRILEAVTSFRS
jgi:dTDP-4-amino-4,6-dideoxygalactose transaminase